MMGAARANMTLEVVARVCAWPHAATMGAIGLLHLIVKNNLDVKLYSSTLVQVRQGSPACVCCVISLSSASDLGCLGVEVGATTLLLLCWYRAL